VYEVYEPNTDKVIGYRLTKTMIKNNGESEKIVVFSSQSLTDCRKKLKREIQRFEIGQKGPGYQFTSKDTFEVYAQVWYDLNIQHSDVSDDRKKQLWYLITLLNKHIGNYALKDISNNMCQELVNQYEGYSKQYVKAIKEIGKRIFKKAVKQQLVEFNPWDDIKYPNVTENKRRSLTIEERKLLFKVGPMNPYWAAFLIEYYCGLRPVEVRNLLWENIDLERKILTVNVSKTENGEGRKVPITDDLKKELMKYILRNPSPKYVFPNKRNSEEPMQTHALTRAWNDLVYAMDIENGATVIEGDIVKSTLAPDICQYMLRHTLASDCQAAGVPINVAKEFMGHADISTTAQTYTHMIDETFRTNRDKLEKKLQERLTNLSVLRNPNDKIIKI